MTMVQLPSAPVMQLTWPEVTSSSCDMGPDCSSQTQSASCTTHHACSGPEGSRGNVGHYDCIVTFCQPRFHVWLIFKDIHAYPAQAHKPHQCDTFPAPWVCCLLEYKALQYAKQQLWIETPLHPCRMTLRQTEGGGGVGGFAVLLGYGLTKLSAKKSLSMLHAVVVNWYIPSLDCLSMNPWAQISHFLQVLALL